jgi:hypothetical protein
MLQKQYVTNSTTLQNGTLTKPCIVIKQYMLQNGRLQNGAWYKMIQLQNGTLQNDTHTLW